MPEGVGRNRIGVCVEDPIDLSAGQMAITASWEQIGVICLRSTPEILSCLCHLGFHPKQLKLGQLVLPYSGFFSSYNQMCSAFEAWFPYRTSRQF